MRGLSASSIISSSVLIRSAVSRFSFSISVFLRFFHFRFPEFVGDGRGKSVFEASDLVVATDVDVVEDTDENFLATGDEVFLPATGRRFHPGLTDEAEDRRPSEFTFLISGASPSEIIFTLACPGQTLAPDN